MTSTPRQMELCLKMLARPVVDAARFDRVWNEHVFALKGQYRMAE